MNEKLYNVTREAVTFKREFNVFAENLDEAMILMYDYLEKGNHPAVDEVQGHQQEWTITAKEMKSGHKK